METVLAFVIGGLYSAGLYMIARAAYFNGVPLWKRSMYDDLRDKIAPGTGADGKDRSENGGG